VEFRGALDARTADRVDRCDEALRDPARLAALAETGLLPSPPEAAFDRLARLAAVLLDVPLTIVSLVGADKQFFKAGHGLPAPYDTVREIPIDESICRYTLRGEAIVAPNASGHPLLKHHPTTTPWGIVAFVALPMITSEGQVLGAFCAVDDHVREWTERDLLVLRELTASVMTEIELRVQVRRLQAERELREQVVAMLTHDLRTPLGVVRMLSGLVADGDEAERRELAGLIGATAARADDLVRQLLDRSRAAHVPAEVDLAQVVRSVVGDLEPLYPGRLVVDAPEPVVGAWDAHGVRRLVENLVGNAAKYGSAGTPIRVGLAALDDRVELRVNNLGDPIPADRHARLFEPYQRGDARTVGWGLGLVVVREVAAAHGGTVWVESAAGVGTTFVVRLPRQRPRSQAQIGTVTSPDSSP
jgi:signal transduction histidine kinase